MRASRSIAALVVASLLVAACTPSPSATPTPTSTGGETTAPSAPGATSGASPGPSLPSQTDTAWGRIWDALAPSFPMAPGSQLATDTGEGASSGQLVVASARDVAVEFYRRAFRDASYTIGTNGPLEDGSVTVTATDGSRCQIQLTVRGTGAQSSMVTVLYGAGCPFD